MVILAAAIHIHTAASCPITRNTPTVDSLSHHYDPTDYTAIDSLLTKASKPPFHRRIAKFFAIEIYSDTTTDVRSCRLQLFPAYNSEIGWYLRSAATMEYSTSRSSGGVLSLVADCSFEGSYHIRVTGRHDFCPTDRISYRTALYSLPIEFWGIGKYRATTEPVWYQRREIIADVGWRHRYPSKLFIGAATSMRTARAEYASAVDRATMVEVGAEWGYDTRDSEPASLRGIYTGIRYSLILDCEDMGDIACHTLFFLRGYRPLWRGSVWASEIYGEFFSYNTPQLFWATTDGRHRLRSYNYGRYIDRCMITLQSELRQRLFRSLHGCVWVGVGELFSHWSDIRWDEILPEYGIGLRIDIGKAGRLRFDYGIGRHSTNFTVSLNEAF